MSRVNFVRGFLFLAVFAAFLFTSAEANANPAERGQGGRDARIEQLFDELDLSEAQEEKLKAHGEKHRAEGKELYKPMRDLHKTLGDELEKKKTDMAKIKKIADKIKDLQSKMVDHRIAGILAIKDILSPEQFADFSEKIKKKRERWKDAKKRDRKKKDANSDDD